MAQEWLIPIDGSAISLKPIAWIIEHRGDWTSLPTLHLLNVQPALPRDISRFINADQIRDYHREKGLLALAEAEQQLKQVGLAPLLHVLVGDSAETIVEFANSRGSSQILIGTRGHTGLGGTLLGSVAAKIAHLTHIPLLLLR